MFRLLSGIFMGWSLGSNHTANVFGTAVASQMVRARTATALAAVFVIVGALIGGAAGLKTISGLVPQTMDTAFIATLAAAITITLMTLVKMPVSTTSAIVGAILGIGIIVKELNVGILTKIIVVWVGTPTATIVLAIILYLILGRILEALPVNIFTQDRILRWALIFAGCYGAYSLGANNVAVVTGVFARTGMLPVMYALLLGGLSIALGILTFNRGVIMTVGKDLVRLDPFSALVVVLAHSIMLDVYARVGVPTSSTEAIIGGVIGIGLLKGVQTINVRVLARIIFAWIGTPLISLMLTLFLYSFLRIFWNVAV